MRSFSQRTGARTAWTPGRLDERQGGTDWHRAGALPYGTDSDAVIDPATMVMHGVAGLFVADAWVLPNVTRGNL
ncbi:hypothetical protein Kisp01_70850 [Kineosporia sp. NBRC 101677]|uniref:GMC oxidoreductase n=1 Tax=Kineosporia sp. NBRC 101677 TaxID=3032197 RepID=UPI0024A5F8BE|nr:hypothetical protein Kisp01_70850 [Kineosporia sp. NBRC 101677]